MITVYSPPGIHTAGMSRIVVCPSIGDIRFPAVAEVEAGIAIECALDEFAVTPKRDAIGIVPFGGGTGILSIPKEVSYDAFTITASIDDPQADDPLLSVLTRDTVAWFVHRPGIDHAATLAQGDLVQVTMARVLSRALSPISTDDSDEYEMAITLAVQDTTDLLVPLVP